MSDHRRIYIKGASQISVQQPLAEDWMTAPVWHNEPYTRSIDPNFREWINPLESRRMGKILKRALVPVQAWDVSRILSSFLTSSVERARRC